MNFLKYAEFYFDPLNLALRDFLWTALQIKNSLLWILMLFNSNAYLVVLRYGKIQSAKAILDKTTNKCKGQ